ncbi:YhcH/YjgK/YiaL family protein [Mucilaginibacter terrae]|uniref:Biofilm protein TabA n=1 Tax=Mucilaginibacter terrae TaxID=1955052 RepID=A0ABU3GQP4_9SPHI|nr:YhcH/YjgK/YiaL family protein [Mucilaginibacter terrae]MDT3402104.1 biofilm protein TabA [Mucilaginibacter terrae]
MKNTSAIANPKEWFESRVYLNGFEIPPHESTDVAEFARQYVANKKQWDQAFAYLKNTDLTVLPIGRHALEGSDLYIAVSESDNKDIQDARWESHRKAIDIQYVIAGGERMGVTPLSKTTVTVPYDEEKDVAFYEAEGPVYLATPEKFFLFFPNDAHQPMIKADGFSGSKKIVIKLFYKD